MVTLQQAELELLELLERYGFTAFQLGVCYICQHSELDVVWLILKGYSLRRAAKRLNITSANSKGLLSAITEHGIVKP